MKAVDLQFWSLQCLTQLSAALHKTRNIFFAVFSFAMLMNREWLLLSVLLLSAFPGLVIIDALAAPGKVLNRAYYLVRTPIVSFLTIYSSTLYLMVVVSVISASLAIGLTCAIRPTSYGWVFEVGLGVAIFSAFTLGALSREFGILYSPLACVVFSVLFFSKTLNSSIEHKWAFVGFFAVSFLITYIKWCFMGSSKRTLNSIADARSVAGCESKKLTEA
jgi:hypothetical protein